jgi:hypothetical protein
MICFIWRPTHKHNATQKTLIKTLNANNNNLYKEEWVKSQ